MARHAMRRNALIKRITDMKTKKRNFLWGLRLGLMVTLGVISGIASMQIVQAADQAGPIEYNGHWYEFISDYGINWDNAKAAAELRSHLDSPGHLATITTQAENDFIHDNFSAQIQEAWSLRSDGAPQAWLGGISPDERYPSSGWEWITGENWDFTGWGNGEPNGGHTNARNIATIDLRVELGGWNDTVWNTPGIEGYIVEYDVPGTAPIANAGLDQSIRAGDTVYMDGSLSSDDDTDTALLHYNWSFSELPVGSSAALSDTSVSAPSFVADVAGSYTLQLVVTDEQGLASEPDLVTVSSNNLAPTAVATVDSSLAIVGTTSNFDGTGSDDPEGDELYYSWSITSAPLGSTATLVDETTASPSLTTDVEGSYDLTLTVSDFIGAGTPATVEVVATTPANYAEIQIVEACALVENLNSNQVTTKGNQNAFCNFLKQATKDIQKGKIDNVIFKLNEAIERTNGCELSGSPDGNGGGRDWITDCVAQNQVYPLLNDALNALTP